MSPLPTTKELKKIYLAQPPDVDTKAVDSTLRVQREWHQEKLATILSELNLSNKTVLDLACGSGGLTRKLKAHVPSATFIGVDFNQRAISFAKKRDASVKGLSYKTGDAQAIPLKDNSVDIAIGLDMLDHVPDFHACLSEIYRVLRPGGEIALTVENHHSLWPIVERLWDVFGDSRDYGHVHVIHFNPKTFKRVITSHGFMVKNYFTIHNINTFFHLISGWYPKSINNAMRRNFLGLTLFCHAVKKGKLHGKT
jgi:ubiquinone/menaquinone biosynthesis C-methylase UbiE